MHLTITCNGESYNPHTGIIGQCNDRLTEKGILDSLRLAQKLKNQTFDFIFCSEFGIRRTTTDFILQEQDSSHTKIIVNPNLREKDAEICNSTPLNTLKVKLNHDIENTQILSRLFIKHEYINAIQESKNENTESLYKRSQELLSHILHNYPSHARILIVGNPIINSFLIALLLGKKDFMASITSPCSLSEYEKRGSQWRELSYNKTDHLYLG